MFKVSKHKTNYLSQKQNIIQQYLVDIQQMTNSQYDNIIYNLKIQLPEDYPEQPPKIYFQDIIYHLNVNQTTGQVLISILKDDWCYFITLNSVLEVIDAILTEPDINYAANKILLKQFKEKNGMYLQNVDNSIQRLKSKVNNQIEQICTQSIYSPIKKSKSLEKIQIHKQNQLTSTIKMNFIQQQQLCKKQSNDESNNGFQKKQVMLQQKEQIVIDNSIKNNTFKYDNLKFNESQANQKIISNNQKLSVENIQQKIAKISVMIDNSMLESIKLQQKLKNVTHQRLKKIIQKQLQDQLNHLEQLCKVSAQLKKKLVNKIKSN